MIRYVLLAVGYGLALNLLGIHDPILTPAALILAHLHDCNRKLK